MLYIKNTLSNVTLIEVLMVLFVGAIVYFAPKVVAVAFVAYVSIRLLIKLIGKFMKKKEKANADS